MFVLFWLMSLWFVHVVMPVSCFIINLLINPDSTGDTANRKASREIFGEVQG